jgi:hypothetical protein
VEKGCIELKQQTTQPNPETLVQRKIEVYMILQHPPNTSKERSPKCYTVVRIL